MDIDLNWSLSANLWGLLVLLLSTCRQFYIEGWAKREAERISNLPQEQQFDENLTLSRNKISKHSFATRITFFLLIFTYVLSIAGNLSDDTKTRLINLEERIACIQP